MMTFCPSFLSDYTNIEEKYGKIFQTHYNVYMEGLMQSIKTSASIPGAGKRIWGAARRSVGTRMTLLYLVLIIASILTTNLLYQFASSGTLERKVGEVSAQSLSTIQATINASVANVNSFSKLILADDSVQGALVHTSIRTDLEATGLVRSLLSQYMESSSDISSIYLFDMKGNEFSVGRQYAGGRTNRDFTTASWYEQVVALRGKYLLVKNGGGYFDTPVEEEAFLSHIRVVNSTQSGKPIGLLILNVPIDSLRSSYSGNIQGATDLAVFDGETTLFHFLRPELESNIQILRDEVGPRVMSIEGERYLALASLDEQTGWNYISATPFSDVASEYTPFRIINIFIIIVNSLFIIWGAMATSRMVTRPLGKLTAAMKNTQTGQFKKVEVVSREDEIGVLQNQYNTMVDEIERLFDNVVLEQRFKRKAELNMLQSQIKPHFLYNSLEIIAANVMVSDDKEATYELVLALSNYYRTTLSKGSEVVSMADEVSIVRDYVLIQQARFPGMLTVCYDVEDTVLGEKIMKLVLQPLVENAIYHGIQQKGESGVITITARQNGERMLIAVEDDGVGMTDEELQKIKGGELEINMSSFGLRGTIERLKIFYEQDLKYTIESNKNTGTRIEISVPLRQV